MYLEKITITGEYKNEGSILIGGKPFIPGLVLKTTVFEDEFLRLRIAQENGWFKIYSDNYAEFLQSRNRAPEAPEQTFLFSPAKEIIAKVPVEEVPVEEVPVAELVAEAPKKTGKGKKAEKVSAIEVPAEVPTEQ